MYVLYVSYLFLLEFSFHKPYAMDETESREFQDFLQRHANLAHTRLCAYYLPMIESQQHVHVIDQENEVTTVKLAVSSVVYFCSFVAHC